ncbi:histidine kinase dimerization/phosphoacceptor domain -containing protein [Spirosoma agri]|uniref:histidine kinase n=1 Tax=Spirosoma agri TaxID=1987381 RepID=A0A6M0IJ75_9BACT|nr:histidine kinase dimerization/phosphoacceptor domain -containing protein [Spirosoma agri]NEU68346.1 hypothetical protein [Spirosoma agri]
MDRFASFCIFLFVLWLPMSKPVAAQGTTHLTVQLDRLRKAKATEQEAMAKNDSLLLAEAWYLYGKTYAFSGDYRVSQQYFVKSLSIHEPRGDSFELGRLYVRLSENENRQGDSERALYYANLATRVFQRIHSDDGLMRSYGSLGKAYERNWHGQWQRNRAKFDSIFSCYKKVESLGYQLKDTMGIAEAHMQLGEFLTQVNDPKAIPYLESGLHLFTINHKIGPSVDAMAQLATAYLMVGKTTLAYQILRNAEAIYAREKLNEYTILLNLERVFVHYFETTGQFDKAYRRLKTKSELERSILLEDRNGAIARLNVEYETAKNVTLLNAQKRELALRDQNLLTQRRFMSTLLALLIMALVMSLVFFQLYRKKQRISRRYEDLLKEQNHRVKNNLQVVSSLLSMQSKRLTDETAKKAVQESLLRVQSMAILHQRLYDGDHLAEVDLDDYIREVTKGALQAFGYPSLDTQFDIESIYLPADKAISMGLILNELITNACKYAFPQNSEPFLAISFHKKGQKLILTVTDNGPGMDRPGLDRPGLNRYSVNPSLDGYIPNGSQPAQSVTTSARRSHTTARSFGMALIQAQVIQLNGTSWFSSSNNPADDGTVFTLEFNA